MDRVLDWVVAWATKFRLWTMLLLLVLAMAVGALAPRVSLNPSPKGLVSTFGTQAEAMALLREHFGDSDHVVFVLLEAPDVLDGSVLAFLAELSMELSSLPEVERVDSLTAGAFAFRDPDPAPVSLDDLEAGFDEEAGAGLSAEGLRAVERLVDADPQHFSGDLADFSEQTASVVEWKASTEVGERDVETLRRVVKHVPALEGTLVGRPTQDGSRRVIAVAATLAQDAVSHQQLASAVAAIDARIDQLRVPSDVVVRVTGLPHFWNEMVKRMETDQKFLFPVTLLVCLALLWMSYRWWPAVLLPGVGVLLAAGMFVSGMVLLGRPLNILNNVIPALLIFIGISDSIHLINRYRETLIQEFSPPLAMAKTVRSMALACLLTSVTTAIGLGALVVSETSMLRTFGIGAAMGVMGAYLVTILFLPASLSFFRPTPLRAHRGLAAPIEQWIRRTVVALIGRPVPVLAGVGLLVVASAATLAQIRVDTRLRDQFDADDPLYASISLMDRELSGVRPLEVLLVSDQKPVLDVELIDGLSEVGRWAGRQPGVLAVTDPATPLRELYWLLTGDAAVRNASIGSQALLEALWGFARAEGKRTAFGSRLSDKGRAMHVGLSPDERALRLQIRVADVGAKATMKLIGALQARLGPLLEKRPDLRLFMTGDAYTGSVPVDAVAKDMLQSLLLAVVLIFILLGFVFRSWRVGLLASVANLLPLVFAVAWMVARSIPLTIGTAVTFSISFGLAVDGTIHMVARLSEERRRHNTLQEALVHAAAGTGNAIAVSSLALMVGFLLLMTSGFLPIRHFGELVAVTTLVCFVSTVLVQPVLFSVGLSDPKPHGGAPREG